MPPGQPIAVRLRPGSDGDALHVPKPGLYSQVDPPMLYLEKIGQQWMQARGDARPGVKYILESLPVGYTMWQRPRPSDSKIVDKYLYGHPNQKPFDSPNRFFPHFQHLMDNGGDNIGCPCTVCAGNTGVLPKSSSSAGSARIQDKGATSSEPPPATTLSANVPAMHKGRPKTISSGLDASRVDEEGTPDVYRNLIDKLQRHSTVDEVIEEPLSPDWRAEQDLLPSLLRAFKEKDQWVPRVGDVVLYIRQLPDGVNVVQHEETGTFQLYDERLEALIGHPPWEAGLVGEGPRKTVTEHDLVEDDLNTNVVNFGVRVEPMPDPNTIDKSYSKRHKYVSLRLTRPLVLWKELLHQVPQEHWHPTVRNALGLTSTISLMGKHRFRGTWPNASIYCHGLYLGSEMLAVGDTVRLLPNAKCGQTVCSDILVIKSIRLKWTNLHVASNNDYDEGRPYNSEIWVYGSAYTSDITRSDKQWLSDQSLEPPKVAHGYSSWHPLHPPSKELAIPYSRILGRLFERDAMVMWLDSDLTGLDVGREGLMEARAFSRDYDQRIAQEINASWYWGDNRADALNLQTINGLNVSKYDQDRDLRRSRKDIKLIDGLAKAEMLTSTSSAAQWGKRLASFMAPDMSSLSELSKTSVSGNTIDAFSGSKSASDSKRDLTLDLTGAEIENEIRRSTKVVDDVPGINRKKAKVMVIID
ncbi:hypothetical protein BKA66DRAFT_567319 [Pyrenochaeta sp. MPI-SDFR-AT-0127]|nr:hypothetical protein BKA66DRAFT_567319 [Pyrenochaeta sp. MPI-SDFR-AT-0127]